MLLLNLSSIIYCLSRNYEIRLNDLSNLSVEDVGKLIEQFSYTIALIIKYGTNYVAFDGLLPINFLEDCCYECGIETLKDERYECLGLGKDSIEFICKKCYIKIKGEKNYI